jgi:hypothetical protein
MFAAHGGEVDDSDQGIPPIVQEPDAPNISIRTAPTAPAQSGGAGSSGGSSAGLIGSIVGGLFARGGSVCPGPHKSHVANFLAMGGKTKDVPAMVSPGERYLNPEEVKRVVENGENPLKLGVKFPGKSKVKGDSYKNDTLPETLEEGGVVIPHRVLNKKNSDHAELFVRRAVHMKSPKGGCK